MIWRVVETRCKDGVKHRVTNGVVGQTYDSKTQAKAVLGALAGKGLTGPGSWHGNEAKRLLDEAKHERDLGRATQA